MTPASPSAMASASPLKVWNVLLWAVQILLALMFGSAGVMKATRPIAALAEMLVWVRDVPPLLVRFIGISELLAAVGLILPIATGVRPILTPLAALGLVAVMVLASGFHISRGEVGSLPVTITLGCLAAFVAWGRLRKVPVDYR